MQTLDQIALMRAILAQPDEDTPRLVYADCLEENGQGERAEFIRVQCEIAAFPEGKDCTTVSASWCPVCGDCICPEPEYSRNHPECPLHSPHSLHDPAVSDRRAATLLAANPKWSRSPCPVLISRHCEVCHDTGDLLCGYAGRVSDTSHATYDRPIYSRRGFLDQVDVELADVCQQAEKICERCGGSGDPNYEDSVTVSRVRVCPGCAGQQRVTVTEPTPWALAVVQAVPTLTRLRLTDRQPDRSQQRLKTATWWWPADVVPVCIRRWLDHSYPSHEIAHDALAVAVVKWIRGQLPA